MATLSLAALMTAAGASYLHAQGGPGGPGGPGGFGRDRGRGPEASQQGPDGGRRGPGGPGGPGGFGRFGGGRHGGGPLGGPDLPLRQLDLSDAQRQQVRAILDKARDDARPAADRLRAAADARRAAVEAVPVNENQIRQTTQALAAAETELAIARAHARADVLAQLTPEQQQKLRQFRQQRQERGRDHDRGPGERGGPGGR